MVLGVQFFFLTLKKQLFRASELKAREKRERLQLIKNFNNPTLLSPIKPMKI